MHVIENNKNGAGQIAQQLEHLLLLQNQDSLPSTHMKLTTHSNQCRGFVICLGPLWALHAHSAQACVLANTYTLKLKRNKP